MKKKILLFVMLSLIACLLCSCQNGTDSTNAQIPTQAELEEIFEMAQEYENNGKFKSAIELYRQLASYEFYDPDFGYQGIEKALQTRELRYLHQKILSKYYEYSVSDLKKQLKDPNSLVVYSMSLDHYSPKGKIIVVFDSPAMCNRLMKPSVKTIMTTVIKNAFDREIEYMALPKTVFQSLSDEFAYLWRQGNKRDKIHLTPISHPELRDVSVEIEDSVSKSEGKIVSDAINIFGDLVRVKK
jgi:hypothetical protein